MNRLVIPSLWCWALILVTVPVAGAGFDHSHADWNALLSAHVTWIRGGVASQVDYQGFRKDRERLSTVLNRLSAVTRSEYDGWDRNQRLTFLLNAYNAFTVDLILTQYPDLASIKDLGSLFSNPWKKKFFVLLGESRSLDWIEHDMIRVPGVFDDPWIHAAVNCASIGCPALPPEAFVPDRLDAQLEDALRRFLSDRERNRYNPATRRLEISRIFDWYGGDFAKGFRGAASLTAFLGTYADLLADPGPDRETVRAGTAPVTFLDYDWRLNDLRRP